MSRTSRGSEAKLACSGGVVTVSGVKVSFVPGGVATGSEAIVGVKRELYNS